MREALAASNIDFSPRDERAGNAKRRAKPAGAKRAPFLRRVFGEKGRFRSVLFTGFAGLVAVGVPLNALFMQEGRRPAAAIALKMPSIDAARQAQAGAPVASAARAVKRRQDGSAEAGARASRSS